MKRYKILTWTARVAGSLVSAFFLLFFFGEGIPDIIHGQGEELLRFLPLALFGLAGFVIAWWRPAAGGWLLIASGFLMGGYFLYYNNLSVAIIFALPLLLVGLCFLAAGEKLLV